VDEAATATARSAHDISQLVFRIRWRPRAPSAVSGDSAGESPSTVMGDVIEAKPPAWREELFRWQQKKHLDIPHGDAASGKLVLFTYVDDDNFTDNADLFQRHLTDSARERPSRVARAVLDHHAKHLAKEEADDSGTTGEDAPPPGTCGCCDPSGISLRRDKARPPRHLQEPSEQVMHIMAGAHAMDTQSWHEFTLCSIRFRQDGTLRSRPELLNCCVPSTNPGSPFDFRGEEVEDFYTLALSDGASFDFRVENASEVPPTAELPKDSTASSSGPTKFPFELPSTTSPIVRVQGEIVSASGFSDGEDMFVQWWADPLRSGEFSTHREHTSFFLSGRSSSASPVPGLDDEALHGVSQIARRRKPSWWEPLYRQVDPPVTHFAMPFGFDLEMNPTDTVAAGIPLYFELASVDSVDRYRTEGYAMCVAPISSTSTTLDLKIGVWRPVDTVRTELRRFFVGGTPTIKHIEYLGDKHSHGPSSFDGTGAHTIKSGDPSHTYSRFGFRTETVGELRVRLQVVVQDPDLGRATRVGVDAAARERDTLEALSKRRRGGAASAALRTGTGETRHPATIAAIARAKMRVQQLREQRASEKKGE
jgi:Ciliary basal body-associated, B9 protein